MLKIFLHKLPELQFKIYVESTRSKRPLAALFRDLLHDSEFSEFAVVTDGGVRDSPE